MMRMCNKIKTKAGSFSITPFLLGVIAKNCSQTNRRLCLSLLNVRGEENVNIEVGTKTRVISAC